MMSTDSLSLNPPDTPTLRQAPELAAISVLDAALLAARGALDARHWGLHEARSRRHSDDAIRVAAAIVASIDALRYLLAEYDCAVHTCLCDQLPF